MSDQVNSPDHYRQGAIECIEAIDAMASQISDGVMSYYLCAVLKYVWRHEYKGNPVQDLKKAAWYLDRAIRRVEQDESKKSSEAGGQVRASRESSPWHRKWISTE